MQYTFTTYLSGLTGPQTHALLQYRLFLALAVFSAFFVIPARSQEVTFSESFDSTPLGEVPEGWKWYSLGGGNSRHWVRSTYGFFGPPLMTSGAEYAVPGQVDEDWLVTPQIVPAQGDHLVFDAGQEYVWDDYGSTFHVLISTSTSNRADFTETLASWTETEFPGYPYEEVIMLDLSAYAGMPVYIAFVHNNPVTGEDDPNAYTENWYLDNVQVREVKPLDYSSAEIFGSFTQVTPVSTSNTSTVIGLIVRTSGDAGDAIVSSMTFTTAESSPLVRIKEAILYTTYDVSFIASADGTVFADVYGKVIDPGGTFTISGDQSLLRGDNYFWLYYTLEANESDLVYPYPQVDATFEEIIVNDTEHATTVSSTPGSHAVVPETPPNDAYADAIDLAPSGIPERYGSYNTGASVELEFEKLAYCSKPIYDSGLDGANSVWWHFFAPSDGMINVDLSSCDFNTLLVIQDENFDQLACNRDIDEEAFVFQSRIADFPVEAGKDYYIRVTGEGEPGSPNVASGVVHMDFSFTTPTGIGENESAVLQLYPNPVNRLAYVDLTLERNAEVILDVLDVAGRPVLTVNEGLLPSGRHERIALDVSALSQGTYLVRMRGRVPATTHKLIVINE